MPLPPLLPVPDIHERLRTIFPHGTANRNYVTREIAAKTVFVMLYIGAVEGAECWLRPDQVTRMTDAQATLAEDADREAWLKESMRASAGNIGGGGMQRTRVSRSVTRRCARDWCEWVQ